MVVGPNSITSSTLHLSVAIKAISPYSSEYNSSVCGYDAPVFASSVNPLNNIAYPLSGPAGKIWSCDISSAGNTREFAFSRQTSRKPICLPTYVVIDVRKTKGFKPPRGSWAHISSRIVSIHD